MVEPVSFDQGLREEERRRTLERAARIRRRWSILRRVIPLLLAVGVFVGLGAIAIPNFIHFNCRARQSEAKAGLRSAWHAWKDGQLGAWGPRGQHNRYRFGVVDDGGSIFGVAVARYPDGRHDAWRMDSDEPELILSGCRR